MRLHSQLFVDSFNRVLATAQNGLEVLRLGGLDTGAEPSPFEVVERCPMYRLRRYFPESVEHGVRPPILLVPPMMLDANVFDVNRDRGAVGILHDLGVDPWVIDFGAPDREAGGLERTLADHVVALSQAVDQVRAHTGRDVHLGGYSQGGMFCYQAAAYRRSDGVASVVTFGSPVDVLAGLPFGVPEGVATRAAELLADHVFNRVSLPGWMARTGFEMLDPVKTVKSRLDFVRQLHDRDALLPREEQRRFLEAEGWVAWAGPAVAELFKQFVVHNRMMTGGFVIEDRPVSLAEIDCPVLAFIGDVDDLGQPASVRGIRRAAPRADIYELSVNAGHFGLVIGSTAAAITWPSVAQWLLWRDNAGPQPDRVRPLEVPETKPSESGVSAGARIAHGMASITEIGVAVARSVVGTTVDAGVSTKAIVSEAARTLPRLARLGQMQPHTRISLGKLLAEQGRRAPDGECFLFEDRVHTNAAVNERIDNVVRGLIHAGVRHGQHIGMLMETRPSALVTIAALSRIGAVAVLLAPGSDLKTAVRLGEAASIVADPEHIAAAAATGARVLVLGGGDTRELSPAPQTEVIDLEQIDPAAVRLPDWYRPNPGLGRDLAFVLFSRSGGHTEAKHITNGRWALSAFGTASAAALDKGDTVFCLTPLHHASGLLTSLGGAVAGGSRIALTRSFAPDRFAEEVHRYGVTVVSYTWNLLREVTDCPDAVLPEHHPIRLFIGSGMPQGLWNRVSDRFAPAKVVEFYASTEGNVVLANLTGHKPGAKGRPLPGSADLTLAAYDPISRRMLENPDGLVQPCRAGDVGLLLARANANTEAPDTLIRGVFAPDDAWFATDHLFRRDSDGDYWMMDNKNSVIVTGRGPVYSLPISDALAQLGEVDLAVAYGVRAGMTQVAIAAITLREETTLQAEDVTDALALLPPEERPDLVHVTDSIPMTSWYRPKISALRAAGVPALGSTMWSLDYGTAEYRELTAEAMNELSLDWGQIGNVSSQVTRLEHQLTEDDC